LIIIVTDLAKVELEFLTSLLDVRQFHLRHHSTSISAEVIILQSIRILQLNEEIIEN
jgi:hypothetical protein